MNKPKKAELILTMVKSVCPRNNVDVSESLKHNREARIQYNSMDKAVFSLCLADVYFSKEAPST